MAVGGRLGARINRVPTAVWLILTLIVVDLFYVGVRSGGFGIPVDRIPWVLLVPAMAAFSFVHSILLLGAVRGIVLMVMAVTISFCFEYFGEATGAIFGPYYYTEVLGWKLFGTIPLIIPFAWYMMFYPCYVIANILGEGGPWPERTGIVPIVWLSILGAALMTAWDLTMDPVMSFHRCLGCDHPAIHANADVGEPAWVWIDGGPHFGVPLLNYRGWLITSFVVFLLYRLVETRLPHAPARGMHSRVLISLPVGAYALMALVDTWLGYPEIEDIHLISPFVMGIPAFFAAFQIFVNRADLPMWLHRGHDPEPLPKTQRRVGTGPVAAAGGADAGDAP